MFMESINNGISRKILPQSKIYGLFEYLMVLFYCNKKNKNRNVKGGEKEKRRDWPPLSRYLFVRDFVPGFANMAF